VNLCAQNGRQLSIKGACRHFLSHCLFQRSHGCELLSEKGWNKIFYFHDHHRNEEDTTVHITLVYFTWCTNWFYLGFNKTFLNIFRFVLIIYEQQYMLDENNWVSLDIINPSWIIYFSQESLQDVYVSSWDLLTY